MSFFARLLLTCAFWWSGVAQLLDFPGATAETASVGLTCPDAVAALTIAVHLLGSAAVLLGRPVWLGAGALGGLRGRGRLLPHSRKDVGREGVVHTG